MYRDLIILEVFYNLKLLSLQNSFLIRIKSMDNK